MQPLQSNGNKADRKTLQRAAGLQLTQDVVFTGKDRDPGPEKLRYRERIADGFKDAPKAFLEMMRRTSAKS